jgi:hypothetical protein
MDIRAPDLNLAVEEFYCRENPGLRYRLTPAGSFGSYGNEQ